MANVDRPFGLSPCNGSGVGGYNGQLLTVAYLAAETDPLGIGDPVTLSGTGYLDPVSGATFPSVQRTPHAAAMLGVVAAPDINRDDLSKQYAVGTSNQLIRVVPADQSFFLCQEDSVGNTLALTDIGSHVDFTEIDCDTTTGVSKAEIDSSTAAGGGDDDGTQAILWGLLNTPDNAIGANATWIVKIIETQLSTGTIVAEV